MSGSDQQGLYKIREKVGVEQSQGLTLDTNTARSGYRIINRTPLTSNECSVSARFKIELNHLEPTAVHSTLLGVIFSTSPDWHNGKRVDMTLVRKKVEGSSVGVIALNSVVSNGVPAGMIEMPEIGLPNSLPNEGSTASSDWLTMEFRLKATDTGRWNVSFYVTDQEGNSLESIGAQEIELPAEFSTDKPVYAGIGVGWGGAGDALPLKRAGISAVHVDNFQVSSL